MPQNNVSPLIIAHRGDSNHYPENTRAAFKSAYRKKADAIELDVHLSADGVPMVIHDGTTERTTGHKDIVEHMTQQELQMLNTDNGETIPTLQEVLADAPPHIRFLIELKDRKAAGPVAELIANHVADTGQAYDHFMVISFDEASLRIVRESDPHIAIGVSAEHITQDTLALAEELNAVAVVPNIRHLSREDSARVHESGRQIHCWTCNTPREIAKARHCSADGIMSDDPGRLKTLIHQSSIAL
jgi:glycerophosphoryl diester phosphodiesterase